MVDPNLTQDDKVSGFVLARVSCAMPQTAVIHTSTSRHAATFRWATTVVLSIAVSLAPALHSDEMADRRMEAGTRLFRALLAADLDLPKKTLPGNQLLIVFYYSGDGRRASDLAKAFAAALCCVYTVAFLFAPRRK